MTYDWHSAELSLSGARLLARKTRVISAREAKQLFEDLILQSDFCGDTIFIRRLPTTLRPIDPQNPELGHVSDDPPDRNEVWWTDRRSLRDSVTLAIEHFDAPSLQSCLDPHFDRQKIITFLERLPNSEDLRLKYLDQDFLGFRYANAKPAFNGETLDALMKFKLQNFHWEPDPDEGARAWENFKRHRSFTIGSV